MKKTPVSFATQTENPNFAGVMDISPEELVKMLDKVHVVDVRRPDEYTGELGHIEGSKLIVLDTIPANIDSIPKDEPVAFICKGGGRSAQATAFALQSGCQHVYNVTGGMTLWNKLGLPVKK